MGHDQTDFGFDALRWGLSPEEYADAIKIMSVGGYTRSTRALALQMKYPTDRWKLIMDCCAGIQRGRARG